MYKSITKCFCIVVSFINCGVNVYYLGGEPVFAIQIIDGICVNACFMTVQFKSYYTYEKNHDKELDCFHVLNALNSEKRICPLPETDPESSATEKIYIVFSNNGQGYVVRATPSFMRECFNTGSIKGIVYPFGAKCVKRVIKQNQIDFKSLGMCSHTVDGADVFLISYQSSNFAKLYVLPEGDIMIMFIGMSLPIFNIPFLHGVFLFFEHQVNQDCYFLKQVNIDPAALQKPGLSLFNILEMREQRDSNPRPLA